MELILAILVAGPVGYLTSTRKRGLLTYLARWAIVFPVQTVVVVLDLGRRERPLLLGPQRSLLCLGVGLNRLGSVLGGVGAPTARSQRSAEWQTR